jgi:acetate kinase
MEAKEEGSSDVNVETIRCDSTEEALQTLTGLLGEEHAKAVMQKLAEEQEKEEEESSNKWIYDALNKVNDVLHDGDTDDVLAVLGVILGRVVHFCVKKDQHIPFLEDFSRKVLGQIEVHEAKEEKEKNHVH